MERAEVGIVGAGPVGMYTALRLVQEGHRVHIWDHRTALRAHSRSIGIHPPAWKLLAQAGLEAEMGERAQTIREGQAWWNRRRVGTLDMTRLNGPLVSLPQHETEALLQAALMAADPDALGLGVEVSSVAESSLGVDVRVQQTTPGGTASGTTARVDMLIGCDGKQSLVRAAMGARWEGRGYGIPYLMGDFPDTEWPRAGQPHGDSSWRHAAIIMLGRQGLVESFPLPHGVRRWVVRLPGRSAPDSTVAPGGEGPRPDKAREAQVDHLVRTVHERTGLLLPANSCRMVSAFGVERREAVPMARGRMVLLGDAAHIVSPIGGQGMNLGWIEAEALVQQIRREGISDGGAATRPGAARRQARCFRAAARRAEFNMWMGAPCSSGGAAARRALVHALTLPVIRDIFVRRFTMHGL